MADKPDIDRLYTERTGGRYVRDKATGLRVREDEQPAPETTQEPDAGVRAAAEPKKGR